MLKDKVDIQRSQMGSTRTTSVHLSKECVWSRWVELSSQHAAEKQWASLVHCSLLLAENPRHLCLFLSTCKKKALALWGTGAGWSAPVVRPGSQDWTSAGSFSSQSCILQNIYGKCFLGWSQLERNLENKENKAKKPSKNLFLVQRI